MKILKGVPQTYDWGKVGTDSEVYSLLEASGEKKLCSSTPYAEVCLHFFIIVNGASDLILLNYG